MQNRLIRGDFPFAGGTLGFPPSLAARDRANWAFIGISRSLIGCSAALPVIQRVVDARGKASLRSFSETVDLFGDSQFMALIQQSFLGAG